MSADSVSRITKTRELQIVNADGDTVIRLGTSAKGQPEIQVTEQSSGCPAICIEVENGRLSLAFLDRNGALLAGIGSDQERGGGLTLSDANGNRVLMITAGDNIEDSLSIAKR